MAWSSNSNVVTIAEDATTSSANHATLPTDWLPFDARLHVPMVREDVLADLAKQAEVDEREEDRAAIKRNLRSIMANRLLNESARVKAASELAKIHDNEELDELRAEVSRLRSIVEANAEDDADLPPMLRRRR